MQASRNFAGKFTHFVKIMGIILSRNSMVSSPYARLAKTHRGEEEAKTQQPQKGFVFLYVGKERKRYEVPVDYINYPILHDLLKKLLEDGQLECRIDGPIVLLCSTEDFDKVLEECARNTNTIQCL